MFNLITKMNESIFYSIVTVLTILQRPLLKYISSASLCQFLMFHQMQRIVDASLVLSMRTRYCCRYWTA